MQETMLRAWKARDRCDSTASARTWLYRIATNACLSRLEGGRGGCWRRPGRRPGMGLAALEAVTAGLRRRFAGLAAVTAPEVAAHLTGGLLLAPSLPARAGNTTLILMAAVSPP